METQRDFDALRGMRVRELAEKSYSGRAQMLFLDSARNLRETHRGMGAGLGWEVAAFGMARTGEILTLRVYQNWRKNSEAAILATKKLITQEKKIYWKFLRAFVCEDARYGHFLMNLTSLSVSVSVSFGLSVCLCLCLFDHFLCVFRNNLRVVFSHS